MGFRTDPPGLDLDQIEWEELGETDPDEPVEGLDARSRLLAHIHVGGLSLHLEAIEVRDDDGMQTAVDPVMDDTLERLIDSEGTTFQTLDIEGRSYVLYATPYGA